MLSGLPGPFGPPKGPGNEVGILSVKFGEHNNHFSRSARLGSAHPLKTAPLRKKLSKVHFCPAHFASRHQISTPTCPKELNHRVSTFNDHSSISFNHNSSAHNDCTIEVGTGSGGMKSSASCSPTLSSIWLAFHSIEKFQWGSKIYAAFCQWSTQLSTCPSESVRTDISRTIPRG